MEAVPDIIDSEQCAALLKCSVAEAEEMARKGEIPGTKIGRSWIFVRSDLLSYIAERARAEAQERRSRQQAATAQTTVDKAVKSRRQPPPRLPALAS